MKADPARARAIAASRRRRVMASRPLALAKAPVVPQARALPSWLAGPVRNAAGDTPQLDLYDEIGGWGITASEFSAALAKLPAGDIQVNVSSPGGDVFQGLAMLNTLRQRPGRTTVVVTGLAASAASVIAMGASPGRLFMSPNSTMMIHSAWAATIGDEDDHRQVADLLDSQSGNIADIYATRAGQPASLMRAAMKAESWYLAQEAVTAGLADAVLDGDGVPEDSWWGAFAASAGGTPQNASGGPGRPGSPALRAAAYSAYAAQTGRGKGGVSPFVAAIFRGRA
jgi:ATP-dependent protease ClpP protease subunit